MFSLALSILSKCMPTLQLTMRDWKDSEAGIAFMHKQFIIKFPETWLRLRRELAFCKLRIFNVSFLMKFFRYSFHYKTVAKNK